MKTIFTLFIIFISFTSNAQYPPVATPGHIQAKANQLTEDYNKQLALTGIQIPLFKNVVEEYLVKAEKTIQTLKGREQLNMLVELQARETLEMNDILTQPQYALYKKLKFEMQPLKTIKK